MITNQNVEPINPTRVVLIGASGFIGKEIHAQLEARGIPVVAPSSNDLNLMDGSATGKLSVLIKPTDAVVMLAVLAPNRGRDIGTFMKNLAMVENLCAAFELIDCSHLIYISSDAVYNPGVSRVTEDVLTSPTDLYGAMHLVRELMILQLKTMPITIIRPTLVYGYGDTHNAYGPNRFWHTAQKDGQIVLFGEGEELRDHIHVQDVAALIVRCLLCRSIGTLNLATGSSMSFREMAELIANQFDRKIEIVETIRNNPVTHRHFDVTNLIKAFPNFRFVSAADGISRIYQQMMVVDG